MPQDRPSEKRRLDVRGAVLATAGLGADRLGPHQLRRAGEARAAFRHSSGWRPAWSLFGVFIRWERIAPAPMVKLELFRSRAFSGANVYTLILFFAFMRCCSSCR